MTSTTLRMTATWLTCAMLAATTPATAQATKPAPAAAAAAPEPSAALKEQLAKPLAELQLEGVPFADAIDLLRDVSGANIHLDWSSLRQAGLEPTTPVSASIRGVPFSRGLDTLLAGAAGGKATYLACGDVIWLVSKDAAPRRATILSAWAKREIADPGIKAQLDKRLPAIKTDNIPFADVVDFLRDVTGANIFVNWRALGTAGASRDAPLTLRLRNVTFHDALLIVIESLPSDHPLDVTVERGVINIDVAKRSAT